MENVREKRRVMGLFDKEPTNRIRACLPSPGSSSLLCFSALCRLAGHNEIISIEIELSVRAEVTEGEHEIEPADRGAGCLPAWLPGALLNCASRMYFSSETVHLKEIYRIWCQNVFGDDEPFTALTPLVSLLFCAALSLSFAFKLFVWWK